MPADASILRRISPDVPENGRNCFMSVASGHVPIIATRVSLGNEGNSVGRRAVSLRVVAIAERLNNGNSSGIVVVMSLTRLEFGGKTDMVGVS
jgi:hypothetical protein